MKFLETLKLENGVVFHTNWHQKRINETFKKFYEKILPFSLQNEIKKHHLPQKGLFKIRILYSDRVWDFQVEEYSIKKIINFEIIDCNSINYDFKFENRTFFENFKKNAKAQEIIILKEGKITDTSFSNLVFFNNGKWYTPKTFLLNGTCRQRLLHQNKIFETDIGIHNLLKFEKIGIINAMQDLEENCQEISEEMFVNLASFQNKL